MDRTFKILKPSGHQVAEIVFSYDQPRQVSVHITEFRQLYPDDDPDDDRKSVYEAGQRAAYPAYREFDSIDNIKAFDREFAKRELGHDLPGPLASYRFEYDPDPVLLRYVATHPHHVVGLVDVRFSFINNTKTVAFRSAKHPRFDQDIVTDSLETIGSCLARLMLYDEPVLAGCDVEKLEPWY